MGFPWVLQCFSCSKADGKAGLSGGGGAVNDGVEGRSGRPQAELGNRWHTYCAVINNY